MDFGLKIAKRNHSISETDRYMIMNTKYPVLKNFMSGTGTLNTTSGNGGGVAEITHNLGYVPRCTVYGTYVGYEGSSVGTRYGLWNRWVYQGLQEADLYYYYADNTKLYIVVELSTLTDDTNYAFSYMYHIKYDEDTL